MSCVLRPAVCDENNEPNDTIEQATLVSGTEHQDLLCRGDVDVVEVAGHADTRLRIHVDFDSSGDASGMRGELLDASGVALDADLASFDGQLTLTTSVDADAAFFVVLRGDADAQDEYTYTLTVRELEPLLCLAEPGEPNDELIAAAGSPLTEGAHTRSLCGELDVDHHQIVAAALLRTVVTVDFLDVEGDINLELLRPDGTSLATSSSYGDQEQVRFTAGASDETLVVRVARQVFSSFEEEQGYLITVASEVGPDCDDGREPDGDMASASPIGPGSYQGIICDQLDHDYFAITLAQTGDVQATMTYSIAEGDLELELLGPAGAVIETSSTPLETETVLATGLVAATYFVHVYAFLGPPPGPEGQPYTLTVSVTGDADAGVEDAAADAALPDSNVADGWAEDAGVEDGGVDAS
jgi:hypothetical protein